MTRRPDDLVSTNRFDSTLHSEMPTGSDNLQKAKRRSSSCLSARRFSIPGRRRAFDYVQKHKRASVEFVSKWSVRGAGEASATANCLLQIPCGSCTPTHERRTSNRVTWVALGPPGLPMPCLPCQALSGPRRRQTAFLATPHWSLAVSLSPQWGNPSITQSPSSAAKSAIARFFLAFGSGRTAFCMRGGPGSFLLEGANGCRNIEPTSSAESRRRVVISSLLLTISFLLRSIVYNLHPDLPVLRPKRAVAYTAVDFDTADSDATPVAKAPALHRTRSGSSSRYTTNHQCRSSSTVVVTTTTQDKKRHIE